MATYTLIDIPPALQRELDSFAEWRLKPINRDRDGVSVEAVTVAGNKADALRLLGWLKSEKNIAPSFGGVFGSERLGQAVQAFVEHLRACGRTYATCAGYIKSFIAVARFVHAARVARAPQGDGGEHRGRRRHAPRPPPDHAAGAPRAEVLGQAQGLARLAGGAHGPRPRREPVRAAQGGGRARRAHAALRRRAAHVAHGGAARPRGRGAQAPAGRHPQAHRSAAGGGGFELDLRTPDAHKTAALFGPSTTPVPAAACALLRAWLAEAGLAAAAAKPYVFVLGGGRGGGAAVDHSKPLGASRWTEAVKAVLKRQAGVPLAPKDLRSSFITFLLSDANSDEALKKAVAHAMRHSPAQQGSAAYDKEARRAHVGRGRAGGGRVRRALRVSEGRARGLTLGGGARGVR